MEADTADESSAATGATLTRNGVMTEAGQQEARATRRRRRAREPSPEASSQNTCWSISAPKGRHTAICATCCSDIASRLPRVRSGDQRSRVHHVGCVASQCGDPQFLTGWSDLDTQARTIAAAHFDSTGDSMVVDGDGSDPGSLPEVQMSHPGPESRVLQRMEFWDEVPWRALHDPVRSIDFVPRAVTPALAELRSSIAAAANVPGNEASAERCLKCFFFLDRLVFGAKRRQRAGARGQQGETVSRTLARRIRMAWNGAWGAMWEESTACIRVGLPGHPSESQRLAQDVKSIEEALKDEEMKEALRCVDAKLAMASDNKARRCLPRLFPQASLQPAISAQEPNEEDVQRFRRELRCAYLHAPAHRAAGPGCSRNEHWSWMPRHEEAWLPIEDLLVRLALAKLPEVALKALMSARILAADRSETAKVRPLALGIAHGRLVSKAVGRMFQSRVAAAVGSQEHSIGSKVGAELMHKSVLVALDSRVGIAKVSFDASNAYNEFDRTYALQCVQSDVPEMVPWIKASLSVPAVHEYVGADGTRTELQKTRGGDQGDALTGLIFPLTYKHVAHAVQDAIAGVDPLAHVYTYQDDMEAVCALEAIAQANIAYGEACARAGLRANLGKTRLTPGRDTPVISLPPGFEMDERAIVLKHGDGTAVPARPAATPAHGSQLAEGSEEIKSILQKRALFFRRLGQLRSAGLKAQSALDMLRLRTAGDYVFVARACGIPAREAAALDAGLLAQVDSYFGAAAADPISAEKIFLRSTDGGLGFQSVARTSPAAYAASWHTCIPKILARLNLQGTSALMAVSPWTAT